MGSRIVIAMLLLGWCEVASANWSLNLGYHNPPGSTVGVNFLYRSGNIGFEVGVGWIDVDASVDDDSDDDDDEDDEETKAGLALAGDVDVKYFFSSGGVSPYLQGGFGAAISGSVGEDSGAHAGLGGGYAGVGLMAGSNSLYLYLSANMDANEHTFFQAGIGFDI